jgi:TolA-binding protein
MLYNVLPPIIFFMSLGGIIIVISRVVLRLRQQQLASDLQSHVTRVSQTRLSKVQDLAGLLAPNQISVHSFKNRLAFLVHGVKNTKRKSLQDLAEWRQRRARAKALAAVASSNKPITAAATAKSTAAIKPPESFLRTKLASLTNRVRQVSLPKPTQLTAQTKSRLQTIGHKASASAYSLRSSLKRSRQETLPPSDPSITHSADHEASPQPARKKEPVLRIVNVEPPAEPAPPSPVLKKMGQPVKAGSLSQLFKKEIKKSPLQQAAEALENKQTKHAEDLLVPYIIKHPRDTEAYMMLGQAAVRRRAWNEATEIFEQVIKIKPDTEGCYAALGQAALEAGNLTKAIETLQRAHDQNPQNVFVIKCLLQIARRMDNRPMQQSLNLELQQLEEASNQTRQPSN